MFYRVINEIDSGSEAIIYKAELLEKTPEIVNTINDNIKYIVLKKFKFKHKSSDEKIKYEFNLVKSIQTKCFIINYFSYFINNFDIGITMEYIDGFNLYKKDLTYEMIIVYMRQLSFAINYLHENNIIHSDIKEKNILVEKSTNIIKLIDFSMAAKINHDDIFPIDISYRIMKIQGTPYYMAPEIINGEGYLFGADVWSFGVVLYNLVHKELPFKGGDKYQLYDNIINYNYSLKGKNVFIDKIISKIFVTENERITIKDISISLNNGENNHSNTL